MVIYIIILAFTNLIFCSYIIYKKFIKEDSSISKDNSYCKNEIDEESLVVDYINVKKTIFMI